MNKRIGLQLGVFAVLLVVGSGWFFQVRGEDGKLATLAGVIGGILCLVWAGLAALGNRRKVFVLLTLIPVTFFILAETVHTWGMESGPRWPAGLIITGLFVSCMAILMRVAYAGLQKPSPAGAGKTEPAHTYISTPATAAKRPH